MPEASSPILGRYQATPVTLADGSVAYLLLDSQGRVINLLSARNDDGTADLLRVDSSRSLHTTHSSDLMNIAVTTPGVAYANGVNALCLAAPTDETREIEIVSVWIGAKAAGDFYLAVDNLGITPGNTTTNTFDLVGIKGDGVTDTCDVVWAAFFAAQGRGATGGEYHTDCGVGNELYLIAPAIDYNIVVAWLNEIPC